MLVVELTWLKYMVLCITYKEKDVAMMLMTLFKKTSSSSCSQSSIASQLSYIKAGVLWVHRRNQVKWVSCCDTHCVIKSGLLMMVAGMVSTIPRQHLCGLLVGFHVMYVCIYIHISSSIHIYHITSSRGTPLCFHFWHSEKLNEFTFKYKLITFTVYVNTSL